MVKQDGRKVAQAYSSQRVYMSFDRFTKVIFGFKQRDEQLVDYVYDQLSAEAEFITRIESYHRACLTHWRNYQGEKPLGARYMRLLDYTNRRVREILALDLNRSGIEEPHVFHDVPPAVLCTNAFIRVADDDGEDDDDKLDVRKVQPAQLTPFFASMHGVWEGLKTWEEEQEIEIRSGFESETDEDDALNILGAFRGRGGMEWVTHRKKKAHILLDEDGKNPIDEDSISKVMRDPPAKVTNLSSGEEEEKGDDDPPGSVTPSAVSSMFVFPLATSSRSDSDEGLRSLYVFEHTVHQQSYFNAKIHRQVLFEMATHALVAIVHRSAASTALFRSHAHAVLVCAQHIQFLYWDRSAVVLSAPFSLLAWEGEAADKKGSGRRAFVKGVLCMAMLTPKERGLIWI